MGVRNGESQVESSSFKVHNGATLRWHDFVFTALIVYTSSVHVEINF